MFRLLVNVLLEVPSAARRLSGVPGSPGTGIRLFLRAAALAALALVALSCSHASFDGGSGRASAKPALPAPPPAASPAKPSPAGSTPAAPAADPPASPEESSPAGTSPAAPAADPPVFAASQENVDPTCKNGRTGFTFPVKTTLPLELGSCTNGFEVNEAGGTITIKTSNPAGSRAVVLAVDEANYVEPNFLRIEVTGAQGTTTLVLNTCTMRTACYGDPTAGLCRPPEDSIRSFNVPIPAGATQLTFNFDGSSPEYTRVLGLCDFDLSSLVTTGAVRHPFRLIDGPDESKQCAASVRARWPTLPQPSPASGDTLSCQ